MYQTVEIDGLDGLCDLFEQAVHIDRDHPQRPWFRGHAQASWNLIPQVMRGQTTHPEEVMMAHSFMVEAPARSSACPASDDHVGWLCFMRHYGLPTRLLDWTHSVLVAAYFALCEGESDGPSAIWGLAPETLNELHIGQRAVGRFHRGRPVFHAAFDPDVASSDVIAFVAPQIDPRMMLQQAAFTVHGTRDALDQEQQSERFLLKAEIPREARAALCCKIRALGIRRSIIFPGLADLASEIAEMRLLS